MRRRQPEPDGSFGFAPDLRDADTAAEIVPDHAVSAFEMDDTSSLKTNKASPTAGQRDSGQGDQWVVRPKAERSRKKPPKIKPSKKKPPKIASSIEETGPANNIAKIIEECFLNAGNSSSSRMAKDRRVKISLACCLLGGAYLFGAISLFSDYRTFEASTSIAPTPAGHGETAPPVAPIDDDIDLRDAQLDGPFVPKFRPDSDEDIAASELQRPI